MATVWMVPTGIVLSAEKRSPFARGAEVPEEIRKLLDADGDGVVTDEETRHAAAELERQARVKSDRAKAIIEAFDNNRDGAIDGNEAAEAAARARIAADGIGHVVAEIFSQIDKNADGFVSQIEFALVVKQMGALGQLLKPRLVQVFLQIDADRNGAISVAESQMAADYFAQQAQLKVQRQRAQRNQRIWQLAQQAIARLDGNRNGQISQREARRDRQVLAVFEQVDADGDKQLSAEEVYAYLERTMGR
jgi:Ca2+-binding EF-hand superfamily protein